MLAELTGADRTTVWAWFRPVDRNGTGGLIPANRQMALYYNARARGINITCEQIVGVDQELFNLQERCNGTKQKAAPSLGRLPRD